MNTKSQNKLDAHLLQFAELFKECTSTANTITASIPELNKVVLKLRLEEQDGDHICITFSFKNSRLMMLQQPNTSLFYIRDEIESFKSKAHVLVLNNARKIEKILFQIITEKEIDNAIDYSKNFWS